ncbi:MAG TPA: pyridoxamine 5'-phosphate oxidase family protein [Chryseolinea sp.]|nr:pyridoxamine 5'-phosphate oxidase family protein [Chryseolinea sp.]
MYDHIEKLKQIVARCRVGMLGMHREDGIHFSPISHVDIDDDGNLWFFASKEIGSTISAKNKNNIFITYAQESNSTFLSITGKAYLNSNREKMRELFNPYIKAWFPDGLDDPSISLLVVHPLEVECWTSDDRKVLTYNKILSPQKKASHQHHN